MTYKLNPELRLITSPVVLIFPNHTSQCYESGKELIEVVFDKRWKVMEMRAVESTVEVIVEEADVPSVNPIGEETFF